MSAEPPTPPVAAFPKRTFLRCNEIEMQQKWEDAHVFESDPDGDNSNSFMVTFPYPYMNGRLHLGHAFSLTKAVFRAQYERNKGRNVLFPFAFHCTGMPIQAAANKLKAELEKFGCPPQFPEADPEVRKKMEAEMEAAAKAKQAKATDNSAKSKGSKQKLVVKSGTGIVRQWNILKMMVDESEIKEFVDPNKWLEYFPPLGLEDLKVFGSGIDWRRSFITTSVNKYYDQFIRWQFNTLKEKGKILFGKRNNVYSILDGQVCADHDRSEGEGVGPQEYTIIKLKVLEFPGKLAPLADRDVYLAPATLRPETMYGQTNCFVLPTGEYGAFEMESGEVFVISERSARGFACQGYTSEFAKTKCLVKLTGEDLLGLPLKAPHASYDRVYTLPLTTISMFKGTGVVTSVPSDAPDDFVSLQMLKDKPDYAIKFGITPEMVNPFDVVPIIKVPLKDDKTGEDVFHEAAAVYMCEKLKIKSPNEKDKLAKAKDETYLRGFNFGIMTVGKYAGMKVSEAKPIIKKEMIEAGTACLYFEPEGKVMSRTGDECVVAATDQWYLNYGEESWRKSVEEHVKSDDFDAYDKASMQRYEHTLGWLHEWACTRQFGLGTQLPWDEQWVIESLSDSTIYMAYYTIAKYLQGADNLKGDITSSPSSIDPADLTDDVFNFIFRDKPLPASSPIPTDTLNAMKAEFKYWYPMNLRVSAKDLIPNHLTMALYNHAAIWDDNKDLWPRGYYTNGHVQVDAEKMSKSKGNFLMMNETVQKYSCDGTRIACADAGDSLEDANFSRETADNSILTLYTELKWFEETVETMDSLRGDEGEVFMDRVFSNEINRLSKQCDESYSKMLFRDGLKCGFYDMISARDLYRDWCNNSGVVMKKSLVNKWMTHIALLMTPITPHWSEKCWNILGNEGFIVKAVYPEFEAEDKLITRQTDFLNKTLKNARQMVGKSKVKPTEGAFVVKSTYNEWRVETLEWMEAQYHDGAFGESFKDDMKAWASSLPDKKNMKNVMQFASFVKKEVDEVGDRWPMEVQVPFDQKQILVESLSYIQKQLNLEKFSVLAVGVDELPEALQEKQLINCQPGKPLL